jgi:hypothetical protein
LIRNSGELISKQITYEKTQALVQDADRALELIGRSIHMAGYQNQGSFLQDGKKNSSDAEFLKIQKSVGFRGSDSLLVRYQLSRGIDLDCIGNVLTAERTKQSLAIQGFLVERQASALKGQRVNGGSLICLSLDRQGRLQNTTLMSGVNHLAIEELDARVFRIKLEMTDGAFIQREFERTFSTRNLL